MYLANGYEVKCSLVLRYARLADQVRDDRDLESAIAICNAMKDKRLNATLMELRKSPLSTKVADAAILEAAKDARNFIAHESAWVGPLFTITAATLDTKYRALCDAVSALTVGDNLVSKWIYEIEEKEPAPMTIWSEYSRWVHEWIFGDQDGCG